MGCDHEKAASNSLVVMLILTLASPALANWTEYHDVMGIPQAKKTWYFAEDCSRNSKNSNVYHWPNCSAAQKIKAENLVTFANAQEAVNAGYRPCKICNPPLP